MKTEIVFSDNVWRRLEEIKTENVVLLLGWEKDQSLYCIGCSKLPPDWDSRDDVDVIVRHILGHFPCGLKVIGLYRCSKEEAIRNDCKFYLDTLTAPASIEELVVDHLLIFAWKRIDDSTTTFLYDTESEMMTDANVDVRKVDMQTETIPMRVTGHLKLCFDVDNNSETTQANILNAIEIAKKKVSSPRCTFHLTKTSLLLHNSPEKPFLERHLNETSSCADLLSYIENGVDNEDKKKMLTSSLILELKMVFLTTGKQATDQTICCVPVIRYERRTFEAAAITVGIDMMVTVPNALPLSKLPMVLGQGIICQLDTIGHSITRFYEEKDTLYLPEIFHFMLPNFDHLITVVYPKNVTEADLESLRKDIHQQFFLPMDKPLIRRPMSYSGGKGDGYLRNVHLGLPPPGVETGLKALVHGSYSYHHYMQDHCNDDGWGCAYRSLQTLVSWFRHQGYTTAPVPSHVEIQQALVDIGDKPASFINSRQWIGSMEVSFCLEKLIGVNSKIMAVSSGSELASKGRELINHFNTQGTPIMIGGGVLAHTILGVDFNVNNGDIKFLVLDPHYTGSEDINVIQKKGWCGWKGIGFWNKTAYYNLCCPQRPSGI